jgi:hypothetical protein
VAYADRKNVLSKQDVARMSKWANRPREENKIDQARKDLWDGINNFCNERGAAVTSVRHTWPIRIECDPESELPKRLRELGHDPIFLQQETRIGAPLSSRQGWRTNSNAAYSFHTRDVYELQFPK